MIISKGYWNNNGEEQGKYAEMMAAGWNFTKKSMAVFHSYYRYFNDGDFPGWARTDWSLMILGRWGWELNEKGLAAQEERVTERILAEYKRFKKEGESNGTDQH